jgi:signal transduction histidine kinase
VLNSVNVAFACVADGLKRSKAANLSKVVALLREHEADLGGFLTTNAKGKQIPGYLAQLSGHLAGEQAGALKELAQLQKNIEHIKEIVAMQQSYARVSGLTEKVKATDLVEDALRMNAGALDRPDVQLVREYDPQLPEITVEKHKVLQILVNLIRNAKYACDDSRRDDRRLTVRVTNGDHRVRIAIVDNGIGILPENLTRIFNHGFTTRKDGHGFGLHSGALAAKELGGALLVHSDGPGKGATFTLELPCNWGDSVRNERPGQLP